VVFVVLYAPFVGASPGKVMALLSRTTDGATHVELVRALTRHHGFVQLLHPRGLSAGVDHYPSGWHGNIWFVSSLLSAGGDPGRQVHLVAIAAVATYAALAAACTWLVVAIARAGALWLVGLVGPLLLLGAVALGFGTTLLQLAGYSQLAALAALVTLAGVTRREPTWRHLLVAGSAAVVVMHSWYLYAPLALVVLVPTAWQLRRRPRVLAAALLLVVPFCLYPVVTGPAASHVDQPGPVLLPAPARVVCLVVAFVTAAAWAVRHRRGAPATALAALSVAAFALAAALALREGRLGLSDLPYYAAKLLLTALLLGTVLTCAALVPMSRLRTRSSAAAAVLTAAGLALGAVSTSSDAWPPSINPHTSYVSPQVLQALYDEVRSGRTSGRPVIVLEGCDRVWDRVASKWGADLSLTWTPQLAQALVAYSAAAPGDVSMLKDYLSQPGVHGLDVLVRRPCDQAALTQLAAESNVRVVRVR
jgi:hypothetical protein